MAVFAWDQSFLYFDATIDEAIDLLSDVSDFPVEQGADMTDHSRPKNPLLKLTTLVSNTPTRQVDPRGNGPRLTSDQFDVARTNQRGNIQTYDTSFDRVRTVFTELVRLKDSAIQLIVTAGYARYENMLIESLAFKRDAKTGQALSCAIGLKQVRIANTRTVQLPRPVEPRGHVSQNRGNQPATEAPAQDSSGLYNIQESIPS